MRRPTMIMRPNMHEITARGHQARVMAFSPKSWKTGGLIMSRPTMIMGLNENEITTTGHQARVMDFN